MFRLDRIFLLALGLQRPSMALSVPFHGQRIRREPSEPLGRLRAGHLTNRRRVYGCCPMGQICPVRLE